MQMGTTQIRMGNMGTYIGPRLSPHGAQIYPHMVLGWNPHGTQSYPTWYSDGTCMVPRFMPHGTGMEPACYLDLCHMVLKWTHMVLWWNTLWHIWYQDSPCMVLRWNPHGTKSYPTWYSDWTHVVARWNPHVTRIEPTNGAQVEPAFYPVIPHGTQMGPGTCMVPRFIPHST